MHVHLVLPGLLWPGKALHDTAFDLELPALARFFGRGRSSWQPPLAVEDWLCREFRLPKGETPAAALRLQGEGGSPGKGYWLCADLTHLKFQQGRLTLAGEALDIAPAELQQIAEAVSAHLAEHLPGYAEFVATGEHGHAYLRVNSVPQIATAPLSSAIGRDVQATLPHGPEAALWARLGNELQMLLHSLALNREREAHDLPGVNNLWFWGAGSLPERAADAENHYDAIFAATLATTHSNRSLLKGIAAWSGMPMHELPGNADQLPRMDLAGRTLIFDEALLLPAQELDAQAWRDALARIERNWLAPFTAALFSGRMASLRISALGEEAGLDLRIGRRDLMKFWRRPVALYRIAPP